jgi:hypothetical protein
LVGAILNADRFFDKGKCARSIGLRLARKKGVKPCAGPADPLPFFSGWGMVCPRQEG